jgi:seryl-tRNA synthetase
MIDLKQLRTNPDFFIRATKNKNFDVDITQLLKQDLLLTTIQTQIQDLQSQRNTLSKQVEQAKKNQQSCDDIIEQVKLINTKITELTEQYNT